jgi:hypothetical protein
MKPTLKLVLLVLSSLILAPLSLCAEDAGCREMHRVITPKNPRYGEDGRIIPGQALLQGKIMVNATTIVKVVEYPREGTELDEYNSTIIIERDTERKRYRIRDLIKDGEGLRLVEIAIMCGSPDSHTILLAFEAGSTGAAEGFAVIKSSPNSTEVLALPLVLQGGIVLKRSAPDDLELWSTTRSDASLCEACSKHYFIQDCKYSESGFVCTRRPGLMGPLDPDKFMMLRIMIH